MEGKEEIYYAVGHGVQVLYANRRGDYKWQAVGEVDGLGLILNAMGDGYRDLYHALMEEKWRIINRGL